MGLEYTHSLNCRLFLHSNLDGLGSWWERRIVITIFTQQLHELVLVRGNQICQLWVTSCDLLKDSLEHCWVLLYDLAKLLELRVVAQKLQVAQILTSSTSTKTRTKGTETTST